MGWAVMSRGREVTNLTKNVRADALQRWLCNGNLEEQRESWAPYVKDMPCGGSGQW